LVNFMLSLFIGFKNIADYDATDKLAVEETRIPVLLVRPHQLTDKDGSGKYETRHEKSGNTFLTPIPRADVAKFLVDALSDTQWDNKGGVQLTRAAVGKVLPLNWTEPIRKWYTPWTRV